LWFIAPKLVHDVATLNNAELLRWTFWGAMPAPAQPLHEDQLAFFDRRLRVPPTVFNAILKCPEAI
jgi:hypothetical protein